MSRHVGRRAWILVPFVGVAAYAAAPLGGYQRNAVDLYNLAAVVALLGYWLVYVVRHPEPALPWILVGVALAGWVLGDLVFSAIGGDPTVSVADGFYFVGYVGFITAMGLLLRRRTHERDLDSAIDATLIGIACFLFLWIGVIGPAWNDEGVSNVGRLTSAAYPILDVVLLFFLARLLIASGRTSRSAIVFMVAVAAIMVADVSFAILQQTDSYSDGPWSAIDTLWLVGYALLPIAVLLQRDEVDEARPAPTTRSARLVGLLAAGIALVSLPAADIASRTAEQPLTTAVLAVSGALIVALVFIRFIRLHTSLDHAFDEVDRQQRYYRAVADNASDSFVILSPDGTVLDAAGTMKSLIGWDTDRVVGADALRVVHPDDRALARALLADAIANPHETVAGELRVTTADGTVIWIELFAANLASDPAVGGIVVNAHDVTVRKEVEAELEHRALHDSVTGLANRALFRDRIEQALAKRALDGIDVAVLFCDLDGFKLVNDTIGHEAGDEVLRIAAGRLAHSLRPSDTLARIGGDEFAVLIESDGDLPGEAAAIARRLLDAMAQPVEIRGMPMIVTTSIGIAVASQGGERTPDDLLRDADTAMYGAKAAGRNRAVPYDPSMGTAVLTRVQLEVDLRRAVARDELRLRYQPIVELASGRYIGFEALLRWEHPTRGMLHPDEFIGIAEESGSIVEIGRWVLDTACHDARSWGSTTDGSPPLVSVNVSAVQLVQPEFVDHVSNALLDSGLPANALVIEITESALVEHTEPVAARLRALKAVGVHVAIDDFGVGQSSLSYLRRFPVDIMKLDRSFVEGIVDADHVPALIGGLLELARTLDITALAEGIETPAQHEALTREGCGFGQGYLYARPVDTATAARMLVGDATPEGTLAP